MRRHTGVQVYSGIYLERLEALISVYSVCDNDDNLRIRQPQTCAAEHVKYEYFIHDMMIHRDTLLQFKVYLNFRVIISQLCVCIFCDDSQMTWVIVNI